MAARTLAAPFVVSAILCQSVGGVPVAALAIHGELPQASAGTSQEPKWAVVLIEAEFKTAKHPEKEYYAIALPDGLRLSFTNAYGNFARYAFPTEQFPLNQSVYLLSKGLPDLLPVKVTRINATDYRIEWLKASPADAAGLKVVGSR